MRRTAIRRGIKIVSMTLICALVAVACGGDDSENSPSTDENTASDKTSIVVGLSGEPGTLDPHLKEDSFERAVNDNIYEKLVRRDANGEFIAELATALPEQVDDTTWRFTLRDGISFTDGEPMNADAVVASFERIIDPAFESEQAEYFETMESASAVDDLTVEIKTKAVDPIFVARMSVLMIASRKHLGDADIGENPIGTGPYLFKGWKRGESVSLTANPDYWGKKPSITDATLRFIVDENTRVSALQAGEVNLIAQLPPDLADSAPESVSAVGLQNQTIVLNTVTGLASDVNVRKALNLAVDKEALAKDLFAGQSEVSKCQIVSPAAFGYSPDLEPYPYDPEEAKRLITEAGVAGETIRLMSTPTFPKGGEVAEAIASYWEAAGLNVETQVLELQAYLDNGLFAPPTDARPEAVYLQTSTDFQDAARPFAAYIKSDSKGAYRNAEVDAIAEEAASTADPDTRESLYAEALDITCDDAAFVFLTTSKDLWGMTSDLQFTPRPDVAIYFSEMSFK